MMFRPGIIADGVPSNATLQSMLTGTTGNHDAIPHGVPSGYDWYAHGRIGDSLSSLLATRPYLQPWGQVFLVDGQTIDDDDVIEVSNMQLHLLSVSTGLWTKVLDQLRVIGALYNEDYQGSAVASTPYSVSPNAYMAKLTSGRAFHFYTSSRYLVSDPSDVAAAIVSFDVRILSASGADVSGRATKYIAGGGLDGWSLAGGGTNRDAFVGQMTYVTPQTRTKYSTTFTTFSSLQMVRPPAELEQLTGSYTPGVDPNYVAGAFAQWAARSATTLTAQQLQPAQDLYTAISGNAEFSKLKTLYLADSFDSTLALQNLIADNFNATSTGTHTPGDGIDTNGTSTFFDPGFNPALYLTQNDQTYILRVGTNVQHSSGPFGWNDGTDAILLNPRNTSNEVSGRASQLTGSAITTTGGLITEARATVSIIRDGASSLRLRRNGATIKTDTIASVAINSASPTFGKVGGASFATGRLRVLAEGLAISDAYETIVANAIEAYCTAIDAL